MFVTLFLTMETAELSFIKGVNFPVSFSSSSHLSCSFPPHTPPCTLPLCRCFPAQGSVFQAPQPSASFLPVPVPAARTTHCFCSSAPPCFLKSRHPSCPKCLACLSPPCLQVLLAISGFAGNKNRNSAAFRGQPEHPSSATTQETLD